MADVGYWVSGEPRFSLAPRAFLDPAPLIASPLGLSHVSTIVGTLGR